MTIAAHDLLAALTARGVAFFAGVPDSLLASFCAEIGAPSPHWTHRIAANEGSAIALAAGYHLATGRVGCVYMQNSGLGNATNPLVSLADPLVYGVPMVMIVGWRAEIRDGKPLADEPQHARQGLVTLALLDTLSIPYVVLGSGPAESLDAIGPLIDRAAEEQRPVAIVVRKNALAEMRSAVPPSSAESIAREDAIALLAAAVGTDVPIVATTGKIARELYEIRKRAGSNGDLDFLTVGSMGHASQIAAGIAMTRPGQPVLCLDGDGAALMHLGGLTVSAACPNLRHVVLNNRVHDSVGGQPTSAPDAPLAEIARACGYRWTRRVVDHASLVTAIPEFLDAGGSALLEVMVRPGARADLGRPDRSPHDAKIAFMTQLAAGNGQ